MTDKSHVIEQTNLAFDFIEKLYLEISYLIKEVEGILREQEEKFIIGRPSGYGVTARSSTGLESNNVSLWLMKNLAVFFVPEEKTKIEKGQTITNIGEDLKVLYLRIVLNSKDIHEPTVYSGIIYDIKTKPQAKWIKKFEHVMSHMGYNNDKIFKDIQKIDYEDAYIRIRGELIKSSLFSINDSKTIVRKIITPSLDLYRKV